MARPPAGPALGGGEGREHETHSPPGKALSCCDQEAAAPQPGGWWDRRSRERDRRRRGAGFRQPHVRSSWKTQPRPWCHHRQDEPRPCSCGHDGFASMRPGGLPRLPSLLPPVRSEAPTPAPGPLAPASAQIPEPLLPSRVLLTAPPAPEEPGRRLPRCS